MKYSQNPIIVFSDEDFAESADLIVFAAVTEKLDQLKTARGKRGRMYNSVEEFMAERAMIIDLAMSRGQAVQVKVFMFLFLLYYGALQW